MAVKVGNSWVSEAALSYAKVKADSGESATLNGLLDRYPGVNFSTNTQAFSQKGTNNIQITPIILAQMQNNPDKRIEYEALIYDCAKLISSGAMDWAPAGSHVKAAGTTKKTPSDTKITYSLKLRSVSYCLPALSCYVYITT